MWSLHLILPCASIIYYLRWCCCCRYFFGCCLTYRRCFQFVVLKTWENTLTRWTRACVVVHLVALCDDNTTLPRYIHRVCVMVLYRDWRTFRYFSFARSHCRSKSLLKTQLSALKSNFSITSDSHDGAVNAWLCSGCCFKGRKWLMKPNVNIDFVTFFNPASNSFDSNSTGVEWKKEAYLK